MKTLDELKCEMEDLVEQIQLVLHMSPDMVRRRAESYWFAQLRMALSSDHEYLGGNMCTMQDSINELEEFEE